MSRQQTATLRQAPMVDDRDHPRFAGLTPDDFKGAFRNHAAGVAVVTADVGDGPVGLTATSVSSISADPPLLVFSLSGQSSSAPVIQRADTLVVHLLGSAQLEIAKLCATSGVDRFADTDRWSRLPTGEPYFPSAHSWIRGRVIDQLSAGNSTVIVVHAVEAGLSAETSTDTDPLVYHNRTWHRLDEKSALNA